MRYLLVLLILSPALSAQTVNPNQVRGTAVVQTSTETQSINGSVNTQSINTILNPTQFSGVDIGAKINNAIASVPGGFCGEIDIPSGTFNFSTTILLPRCVQLRGRSTWSTTLFWTPPTGTAIVVGDTTTPNAYTTGTISQMTIRSTSQAGSVVGIYMGGDPDGSAAPIYYNGSLCTRPNIPTDCPSAVPFPSSAYADFETLQAVRIQEVARAVVFGNHAFNDRILDSQLVNNQIGIDFPASLMDSGENISIVSTLIGNNSKMGARLIGQPGEFSFVNGSFDYNGSTGNGLAAQIGSQANFINVHFEQNKGRFLLLSDGGIGSRPSVNIYGGTMAYIASGTGTDPDFVEVTSAIDPLFNVEGTQFFAAHPVRNIINWATSAAGAILRVGPLPFYGGGSFPLTLTNTTCQFKGCQINDSNGVYAYNSDNSSMNLAGDINVHTIKNSVGFQQTSGPMITCGPGRLCTVRTGTFPITEPNTNYQLVCTVEGSTSGAPVVSSVNSKSTKFASIDIFNLSTTASSSGGTLNCILTR